MHPISQSKQGFSLGDSPLALSPSTPLLSAGGAPADGASSAALASDEVRLGVAWGGDGHRGCSARENPSRAGDEGKPNPSLYASALPAYGMPRQQRRGISFLVSPPLHGEETQEQERSPGARQRLFLPSLFAQPRWGTPAARVHKPLPGLRNAAGN